MILASVLSLRQVKPSIYIPLGNNSLIDLFSSAERVKVCSIVTTLLAGTVTTSPSNVPTSERSSTDCEGFNIFACSATYLLS